jgi:hypothetical protein
MSSILAPPVPLPKPVLEVQNKQATLNEYNVAYALTAEGFEYIFRATYWGGRRIRGGVEVDFMVDAPFPTPLEVFGNYWHTGQFDKTDKLRLSILQHFFNTKVKIIWGNESETVADARQAVRRVFRL